MNAGKPTDDTITLVAILLGARPLYVDDIREGLGQLGFRRPSSQWLTARLVAMCKESCPRFERRRPLLLPHGSFLYQVTSWAVTGLGNQWSGFHWLTGRTLPTPQPEETTN